LDAIAIADLLEVHVNTIYADLHIFDQQGLSCLQQPRAVGAPAHLRADQLTAIWHLAEQSPIELGLPFGRWSLAKLRDYLMQQRLLRPLKRVSREHLRRLLKKGGCAYAASNASSSAKTRSGAPSYAICVSFGGICHPAACCCFSMSSRSQSKPTVVVAIPRPSA
jgi:transposase